MACVSILVGWEDRVSSVERVSSVGVTDVSSLVETRRWCFVRVFLDLLLRAVGLFH